MKHPTALLVTMLMAMLFCLPVTIRADSRLEETFKTPPQPARLQAYWFWVDSDFSKAGITKDLEAMKAAGFGAALILNVGMSPASQPWPEQTYRSQAWFDAVKHAAAEADRLGMTIGLTNAPGYTGTGGTWVPEEQNMRELVWTLREIEGPQKLEITLPRPGSREAGVAFGRPVKPSKFYADIAVLAAPAAKTIALKQVVDLTANMQPDGRLSWEVPAGKWSIYRIGYAPTMKAPHPAPSGMKRCLEVDKMDKDANITHWQNVIEPLKKTLGPLYGRSFNRLHVDSYECGCQNWTPRFREQFLRLKGYDPVPWLVSFGTPVLGTDKWNGPMMGGMKPGDFSRIIEDADRTARFEWDYVDVVNRLFTENWLLAKSMMAPDKVQFSFEPYAGPFNTIEGAAIADVPMSTFWTTPSCNDSFTTMNGDGTVVFETPAGARAAGHTVINAESFTSMPRVSMWTEKPALLKYIADGAFSCGVNQMTLHHWTLQPFDDKYQPGMAFYKWGVHFSRFQTWFEPGKAFFSYLIRCQAMLQQGEQVVDSLAIDSPFKGGDYCDLISSYDFVNDDTRVVDGKVQLASGRKYHYVSYPANGVVLPEVAAKLKRLLDGGAMVVTGRFKKSPSLKEYPAGDQAIAKISQELWDAGKYQGHLFGTTADAVKQLALAPDYEIHSTQGPASVKVLHRRTSEADIYFVVNRLEKPQNPTIAFRVQGKQPELWQAEDLSICDAPVWEQKDGRTAVSLSLGCRQTVFVVFRRPAENADHAVSVSVADASVKWSVGRDGKGNPVFRSPARASAKVVYASGKEKTVATEPIAPARLDGPWDVSFAHQTGDKFALPFPELVDFSKHAEKRVNYFAGTATYRKTLRLDAGQLAPGRRVILDLGTMNDIAAVKINGSAEQVLWYAPYTLDVTGLLRAGDNQLEIAVTNNWANALIGDEQIPADFPNGHFPNWLVNGQPRPSARKTYTTFNYSKKDSELKPAGLVGPVQLCFVAEAEL